MASINNPPINEPVVGKDDKARPAWTLWFAQVFRGSAFLGSGTTANRPPLKDARPWTYYGDTTLGIPIWVNATATGWVNSAGAAV